MSQYEQKIDLLVAAKSPLILDGINSLFTNEHDFNVIGLSESEESIYLVVESRKIDILLVDDRIPRNFSDFQRNIFSIGTDFKIIYMNLDDSKKHPLNKYLNKNEFYVDYNCDHNHMKQLIKNVHSNTRENNSISDIHSQISSKTDQSEPEDLFNKLTKRELEVLNLLVNGHQPKKIGKILGISRKTVDTHKLNAKIKLKVRNDIELLKLLIEKNV